MDGDNAPAAGAALKDQILKVLNSIVILHVTTVIGSASISDADNSGAVSVVKLDPGGQKIANTVINMAIGDSTTIYSQDFASDPALQDIHKTAVQTAHDIRKETVDILKTLFEDFKDLISPSQG
jgi:hypothetical protein